MDTVDLIGSSPEFRAVLEDVERVAPIESTVLIQGETGTGKELIARAIHQASPRRQSRFVTLNCAAIPSSLLESELFGHERGAFTGAATQTVGRFQAAHGGTLFLDEIGDLPLELQPKLLRVLQEKEFERLGSSHTVHADVRVITATNQDLGRMVEERKFRADLFYRLDVLPITLPPLRERKDDIPLLAEHFMRKFAQRLGKSIDFIPDAVMRVLKRHHWPGNIRELQNVIERSVILTTGPGLDLWAIRSDSPKVVSPSSNTLVEAQRAHIVAALRRSNWVVSGPRGAAVELGLRRSTLSAMMQRLKIQREASPQGAT